MDGVKLERQSSIEDEPRTLDFDQIEFAREAALYVVSTRSIQEAFTIFTQGLDPVTRSGEGGGQCERVMDEKYWDDDEMMNRMCGIRDIVSAPF